MGKGEAGGGVGHARRHTGGIVAAVAGATAVGMAAAVAARQRRRWRRAISPEDSLAGPPRPRGQAPAEAAEPIEGLTATTAPHRSTATPTVDTPLPPVDRPTATASLPRRRPRVPWGTAIVAGLAFVLVLGTGALAVAGAGDDGAGAVDPRPSGDAAPTTQPTTTTTALATAADAFTVASQRLTDAGSFSYTGTASATDVSSARPTLWLAVETTVDGRVDTTTGRVHELAAAADGSATETVTAGPDVWGRRASTVAALVDEPYEGLPALSGGEPALRGAALLPWWLAGVVAPTDAGVDELGRHTFQATLPAALLGVIEREQAPVDGTVTLTLDEAGEPARVEIASSPDGPAFHLVFDIDGLGVPVTVETPSDSAPAAGVD